MEHAYAIVFFFVSICLFVHRQLTKNNSLPYLMTSKFSPITIVRKNIAALKLHQRFNVVTRNFSQQAYYGEKKKTSANRYEHISYCLSKKEGKEHESIQTRTAPDQGHHFESDKKHHTQESQELNR